MSRIHEALKKAEQELLDSSAVHNSANTHLLVTNSSTLDSAVDIPSEVAELPEADAGIALDESWLTRIAPREWKPDNERLLFADATRHYDPGMEEFRTLRSRLYQLREKTPIRTVMIASALPGEGKTFVSSNLGHALARQHGRRVLIIDGDIRKPHLHECMGAPEAPGLNEYLAGETDEAAILQRGPLENLFFIPGGRPVSNPSELIANGRLKLLFDNIAHSFHWVVIDSPPVVPISDAAVIAAHADAIVLVVRAEETPVEVVQRAKQELKGRRIAGVVLNRAPEKPGYNSYYYTYGRTGRD